MKLALVISSLDGGGSERVLSLLANRWAARGEDVTLITLDAGESDRYELHPRIRRIMHALMKASDGLLAGAMNNGRRVLALRRALTRVQPDTLLSFGEQTNVLVVLAATGTGIRCVISERTDPTRHQVGGLWRLLRRLVYPRADALVVQSLALRGWAERITGRQRAHVIPNPVRDMTRFANSARREEVIVAMGRLTHEKGLDLLVRAFAAVAGEFRTWRLLVAGDGPELGRLRELARSLGVGERVTWRGWLAEPGDALAEASVFVLPSRYEGFPNALLEAMSCGLAVISTAFPAALEIVSDGVDGLLVPVESVPALSAALSRLMGDATLRNQLGSHAADVSRRFELESIVVRWDAVLEAHASDRDVAGMAVPDKPL